MHILLGAQGSCIHDAINAALHDQAHVLNHHVHSIRKPTSIDNEHVLVNICGGQLYRIGAVDHAVKI